MARIAVVDDEPAVFETISCLMAKTGEELDYYPSGELFLHALDPSETELVLMDVMMPGMGGLECCRRVRNRYSKTEMPVLFMTALGSGADVDKGFEVGGNDYLVKPVRGSELRSRIGVTLESRRHLDETQRQLELRKLLSDIALHDARNPLQSLLGYLDLFRAHELDEKERCCLAKVSAAANEVRHVIETLLTLSQADESELKLSKSIVRIDEVMSRAVDRCAPQASSRMVRVYPELDLIGGLSGTVDPFLMDRVMDNLLDNALRHSHPNSFVRLFGGTSHSDRFTVRVEDQGRGISDSDKTKVFDRRVVMAENEDESRRYGLGLAFCKLVVDAHGGEIWIEDGVPRGTSICVELPLG